MNRKFNAGVSLDHLIDELPPGLDRTVLRILQSRIGRDNAISRGELLALVRRMPGCGKVADRQLRACVNQMRKEGHLICSTGGESGGYWQPASWDELLEYIEREVHSRAMDLLEQEQALKKEGERRWGHFNKQFKLFG